MCGIFATQDHLATLRPGTLLPSRWIAAIQQHLEAPVEPPNEAANEALATWSALWTKLTADKLSGLPSLEFFITRWA